MFRSRFFLPVVALLAAGSSGLLSGKSEPPPPTFSRVEAITDPLPVYDAKTRFFRNTTAKETLAPMEVLLSRSRYWQEDGHLDVVVRLGTREEKPKGRLEVTVGTASGKTLERLTIAPLPSPSFIFYPELPPSLTGGSVGEIRLKWIDGEREIAEERRSFRVEDFPEPVARAGRVTITLPNRDGVTLNGVPVSVGVPFPRGVLADPAHLKLVATDAEGVEIPLQVTELARWSKYGSIKWVRCDFTTDLAGGAKTFHLEYGPKVARKEAEAIEVTPGDGFPKVAAGRLRFDDGLWLENDGEQAVRVVTAEGLNGAFVEHEDGTRYTTPANDRYEVEHQGANRLVLRREGWYREAKSGREFCRYITRYVIFRDSPVMRLFHTWIFTGDGNRDRIRDMGWKFTLDDALKPGGFLTSFDSGGAWEEGESLVQFNYQQAEVVRDGEPRALPDARTVGAASARGANANLYFGTKDFWQNYPSELEFAGGALWFHNWPRHNRPDRSGYDTTRLSEVEWTRNVFQVRFAHEGKLLDFRLPDELTRDPIRKAVVARHEEAEGHWLAGQPESANAQGISRTEEMWLYITPPGTEEAAAVKVLKALNDETLRAVVDPRWMAQSGAFYEIHPQDRENFPEEERAFDLYTRAPGRWIERLGLYGKWIYGDVATWKLDLGTPTVSLYRTYRSRHHGYPYSWVPYARSGESELLKAAEAATRKLIDANYCHYVSPDVEASVGPKMHRRKGFWSRSVIPWTGRSVSVSRNYESKSDHLWHAWYLTGYERARENALDWGEETKREEPLSRRGPVKIGGPAGTRNHVTLLKSYLDMYEATFDPWFLVAAHAIAEGHRAMGEAATHFWVSADRDFLRFTGDPEHREHYMKYVERWGGPEANSWGALGVPMIESNAHAWRLTGDDAYLRRVAHYVDLATAAVYDGDGPDYLKGLYTRSSSHKLFEGYYLQLFPVALAALDHAKNKTGKRPAPIPNTIEIAARESLTPGDGYPFRAPVIAFQKKKDEPLPLRLRAALTPARGGAEVLARYSVLDPEGREALSGQWDVREIGEIEIPASSPAGVYRLRVAYPKASKLVLPVCPTVDQPEVVELAPGESMEATRLETAFSFNVPPEVRRFRVEVQPPRGTARITVWNPAGERAWDFHFRSATHPGEEPIRAEIEVRPEDAGRLWRITLPGTSMGFKMDPQIPPVYAVSPTRWFEPL